MIFLTLPQATAKPPLDYPHPIITEVLYAVPTRNGDANRDGKRDTAGDEFVELVNPHDRPINLKGYTLCDSGEGKSRFKFTFPAVALEPGQVVVVFNGHDAAIKGAVGDARNAPVEGNDLFSGALVFTARAASSRTSWANKSDYVLLLAPNGAALECVHWGDEKKPPGSCPVIDQAPAVTRGSVQRARVVPDDPPADANPNASPREASPESRPSTSPAKTDQPATSPAGPASKAPAKPARPVYQRKPAEKPATPARDKSAMTFAPFEAHPSLPGTLLGRPADPEAGEEEVLFSPGVYPLDRLRQPQSESNLDQPVSKPGSTGESPAKDAPKSPAKAPGGGGGGGGGGGRTNSGDPR